jgi:hypothetical protein
MTDWPAIESFGFRLRSVGPTWSVKPMVAQLLVLDITFSIFPLKSSKFLSEFLKQIGTKTVQLG